MGLALLLLSTISAMDLLGADWAAVPALCLPGTDAIDWRVEVQGEAGVVIWWCEDQQRGLLEHSRVSRQGAAAVQRLVHDPRDTTFIIESTPFRLRPSQTDAQWVAALRRRYTPLCAVVDPRASNSADQQVGELRPGQWLSCGELRSRGTTRVCQASGAPQLDGTLLPADSWIRCEVQLAPHAGWEL